MGFGLALAAPPGPMNAIIAEESVLRGWSAGTRAGLGAMSADACFLLLALYGASAVLTRYPLVRAVMIGVGGLLMWYFAYGTARDASAAFTRRGTSAPTDRPAVGTGRTIDTDETAGTDGAASTGSVGDSTSSEPERRAGRADTNGGFRKAFVLALTNPYQIVFWLTIGVGLLRPGRLDVLSFLPYVGDALAGAFVVSTGSPLLLIGFFAGIGLWITCFPAALVAAGRQIDALAPAVAYGSAAVLVAFGALFLADALGSLL
ncbi:lysine transporter LysE [Halobacteriales archaeon QS_3_64_16]|nr:MAG: lysine transporter LysE [Halobacteriales archaeon QS_3_64_16]